MAGIDTRIQIDGVDELLHRLNRAIAGDARAGALQRLEERLRKRLTTYPDAPPGSTYTRTGTLGRGWAVSTDATGTNQFADRVSVELKNAVSYAGWVQSDAQQVAIHRGRWETDQQALDAETGPFLSDLAGSIEETFGGR